MERLLANFQLRSIFLQEMFSFSASKIQIMGPRITDGTTGDCIRESSTSTPHEPIAKLQPRLIVAANRLPVTLRYTNDERWVASKSTGGLVSGLTSVKGLDMLWVGWPGVFVPEEEHQSIRKTLLRHNCIPIFLSQREVEMYYNGYSNNVLWPLFHYISPVHHYDNSAEWECYKLINMRFADLLRSTISPDDFLWIHDYHLMLLPLFVRESYPSANIGWFLHTPFPSAELFRIIPQRFELIQGLLGSNLVGFHVHDYARHFLSTVSQLTSYEINPYGVNNPRVSGSFVQCATIPIGISPFQFADVAVAVDSAETVSRFRSTWGDRKIILGVDRLDYMKGIPHNLRAFDRFLEYHPEWVSSCAFVQLAVPSRQDIDEYRQLKRQVHELVGSICGKYSTIDSGVPVLYLDRAIGHEELVALYRIADVAFIASLRDGMNLVSYEYVASQQGKYGVVILSEFAGAAQTLGAGCLRINPWNEGECADALHEALTMSLHERKTRHDVNWQYIHRHTSQAWAERFLDALRASCAHRDSREESLTSVRHIPRDLCLASFAKYERPLVLLDFVDCLKQTRNDVTGVCYPVKSKRVRINPELKAALRALSQIADVAVFTSGSSETLDDFLGDLEVHKLADNGTLWSRPHSGGYKAFGNISKSTMASWYSCVAKVRSMMLYFMDRTPGSYVEECTHSLKWFVDMNQTDVSTNHFRDLAIHLCAGPLSNSEAFIQVTNRFIEVRPHGVSLQKNIQRFIKSFPRRSNFVLLLASSSFWESESMNTDISPNSHDESIRISVGPTSNAFFAEFSIPTVDGVYDFLQSLSQRQRH